MNLDFASVWEMISDIVPEQDIKDETNRLMQEKLSEVQDIINKANNGILKKVSNKNTFVFFSLKKKSINKNESNRIPKPKSIILNDIKSRPRWKNKE